VFILDIDIHHGNGIQEVTYDDPHIFYLSIHRAGTTSDDWFYPGTGNHCETGLGPGAEGTNLNIAWPKGGMGNTEYAAAFIEVVLPVLLNFNPDLIIIACGLDAAKGDLLGDCGLSPDMFYLMTNSLLKTAGRDIPLVVALEGGYNLEIMATCMEGVALALLDEVWDKSPLEKVCVSASPKSLNSQVKFDLTYYWNREEFYRETKKKAKTKRALLALKKSAASYTKCGTFLGRKKFVFNNPHFMLSADASRDLSSEDRLGERDRSRLQSHRPHPSDAHLPFKKRKFFGIDLNDDDIPALV
jgi:Histone deacetylase domain